MYRGHCATVAYPLVATCRCLSWGIRAGSFYWVEIIGKLCRRKVYTEGFLRERIAGSLSHSFQSVDLTIANPGPETVRHLTQNHARIGQP